MPPDAMQRTKRYRPAKIWPSGKAADTIRLSTKANMPGPSVGDIRAAAGGRAWSDRRAPTPSAVWPGGGADDLEAASFGSSSNSSVTVPHIATIRGGGEQVGSEVSAATRRTIA